MSIEDLSKQEVFVIEQLRVAREWVFAVKALRAHYDNNYELEAWYTYWRLANGMILTLLIDVTIYIRSFPTGCTKDAWKVSVADYTIIIIKYNILLINRNKLFVIYIGEWW